MTREVDTLATRIAEAGALGPRKPAISAFGRSWRYEDFLARTDRITSALASLDIGARRPLGLLLPPVPTAPMAALAAFRLSATVVPCNPMQDSDDLLDRLRHVGDGVLMTLDLARLQLRWQHLLDETELNAVLVDKMSELLPFPRNILMPLLRGGEIAGIPNDERTQSLPRVLRSLAPSEPSEPLDGAPGVLTPDLRRTEERDILDSIDSLLSIAGGAGRWMLAHHLDDAWALAGMMAPLTAGRELVILPRLDRRTVENALRHERPQVVLLSPKVVEALVAEPPAADLLDLAIVPPEVSKSKRRALEKAAGCRLKGWSLRSNRASAQA